MVHNSIRMALYRNVSNDTNMGLDDGSVFFMSMREVVTPAPVPFTELVVPVCREILYKGIGDSAVRWWDLAILLPNCVFLLFLAYGLRMAVRKLQASSSPIFTAFYGLIVAVCIISVLRCVVSMTVNA
ncbi:hypothetical protein EGW08_016431, partial [Elysia chlorotica]